MSIRLRLLLATALVALVALVAADMVLYTSLQSSLYNQIDRALELRTPLAAVSAYAELFERGASERPDDLRRLQHGIRVESQRMGALVEDLLLLARLDERRLLRLEPMDLVAAAGESVAAARVVGPQWPVALEASAPVEIDADPLRIRQWIDNLLSNVRVHAPEGTSTTVAVTSNGRFATVAVSDRGAGMSDGDTSASPSWSWCPSPPFPCSTPCASSHGSSTLGRGRLAPHRMPLAQK